MNLKIGWRFLPLFLVISGFGGCSALIILPAFEKARWNAQRASCASNLKSIGMACRLYMQDAGNAYPLLSSNGKGWAEILAPYPKHGAELSCPTGETSETLSSDYFFNARLVGIKGIKVKNPVWVIAFGDGIDNGPTNSHLSELPTHLSNQKDSFSTRHAVGANYLFVAGHVKYIAPSSLVPVLEMESGKMRSYTFHPFSK
jgi:hypothetical protein